MKSSRCILIGCPIGYYFVMNLSDLYNGDCYPCHSECLTCTNSGPKDCIECSRNRYRYQQDCIEQCPQRTYPVRFDCVLCTGNEQNIKSCSNVSLVPYTLLVNQEDYNSFKIILHRPMQLKPGAKLIDIMDFELQQFQY